MLTLFCFTHSTACCHTGSIGSACSFDTASSSVYGQICFWRFILGIGVGGEYPLAATVTSESSSAAKRGSIMSAVFAMQGVGALLSGFVVLACLHLDLSTEFTWRFALAFGAIPPLLAFPYRLRMHETETFEQVMKERAALRRNELQTEGEKNPINYTSRVPDEQTLLLPNNFQPKHYGEVPLDEMAQREKALAQNVTSNHAQQPRRMLEDSGYGQFHEIRSRTSSAASIPSAYNSGTIPESTAFIEEQQRQQEQQQQEQQVREQKSKEQFDKELMLKLWESSQPSVQNGSNHQPKQPPHSPPPPESQRWTELKWAWKYYKWHLLGTALTWFLLDVDFYANTLFNHEVTAKIFQSSSEVGSGTTAKEDAIHAIYISCFAVPGYILAVFFLERIGRKKVQVMGFVALTVLFAICGWGYDFLLGEESTQSSRNLFMVIYALTFLFRYESFPSSPLSALEPLN